MKILIIEDNILLRDNLKFNLQKENYVIDCASDGEEGYKKALTGIYDLIILDLMLPKMDGATLLQYLRTNNINTPVLVLSAKNQIDDKVTLFNLGCDDYLTKPFENKELIVRVKSILRRMHNVSSSILTVADLEINTTLKTVIRAGKKIQLTSKEYFILEFLAYNKDRIVSRQEISSKLWGKESDLLTMSNSLDVHLNSLRKKIDDGFDKKLILTKRSFSFVLTDKEI